MRRTLLRCAAILATVLALILAPIGPGGSGEAQAATTKSKIYDDEDDLLAVATFNPGLHYWHSQGKPGPGPNFFTVMDRCGDDLYPGVSWVLDDGRTYSQDVDLDEVGCTHGLVRIATIKTGYTGMDMAKMKWFVHLRAEDGTYKHYGDIQDDWLGSYDYSEYGQYFTHSSVYREPYDGGGDTLTVTVVPTAEARYADADEATDEIWHDLHYRTPVPHDLTEDQVESMKKQLWCHIEYNTGGIVGGPTWDLEAERPNIPWDEVKDPREVEDHKCNWGTGGDGVYYRPPTDGNEPVDLAPEVDAGRDRTGDEGSEVTLKGTAADDHGTPDTAWTYTKGNDVDAGATCTFTDASSPHTGFTCTDNGTYTVTLTADDGVNQPVKDQATVTVRNVAPVLTLDSPADWEVHRVDNEVRIQASFSDPGANDTHTCTVTWDDGTTSQFAAEDGNCTADHAYERAGMDTITVEVADDDGGKDSGQRMVVVYDPRAGLVSGSGTLADGAGFSVTSKYLSVDSTVPTGAVTLAVPTGDGRQALVSTHLDWLVITPEGKVAVKGRSATHRFLGYLESDAFRGVVWPLSQGENPPEAPVYDSSPGASWDVDEARPRPLRAGLTVIDTGWIPGLPSLPGILGDTTARLLDGLPTLGTDLATSTGA